VGNSHLTKYIKSGKCLGIANKDGLSTINIRQILDPARSIS
jgi:hypothetical protein